MLAGIAIRMFARDIPFLSSEKGATWIYIDRPYILEAQREGERVSYRKYFSIENVPSRAAFVVRSMRVPEVYMDGARLVPKESELGRWKGTEKFDLTGLL